ncbi:hypothetical protein BH11ARM2_BH11ARM2_03890 [soil metagenome]
MPVDEYIRDSVIQGFEYTYESAWKLMRRVLLHEIGLTGAEGAARRELFRMAAQEGLIPDPMPWFEFHDARNLTSHLYDERAAERVYQVAGRFLPEVRALAVRLRRYA